MSTTKKINFFAPVAAKQADAKFRMRKIIHVCVWICVLMACITLVVYMVQIKLNGDISQLNAQTNSVENQYAQHIADQTKLSIINTRLKTIISAEKSDIDFRTKQKKLQALLDTIPTYKTVTSLVFTPKGQFTASLEFRTKADMKSFIASIEGDVFQSKVKSFTVNSVSFNLVKTKDTTNPIMNITGELL
ncbi:MAG: hypothetical protein WCO78_04075 [Candidatus Roizmanbacteria bacterium]